MAVVSTADERMRARRGSKLFAAGAHTIEASGAEASSVEAAEVPAAEVPATAEVSTARMSAAVFSGGSTRSKRYAAERKGRSQGKD
jgi:D-serine deaminase-like pyridoxal phosphate-dependent protein